MKKGTQLYLEALEALQEIKVEELDTFIGGGRSCFQHYFLRLSLE